MQASKSHAAIDPEMVALHQVRFPLFELPLVKPPTRTAVAFRAAGAFLSRVWSQSRLKALISLRRRDHAALGAEIDSTESMAAVLSAAGVVQFWLPSTCSYLGLSDVWHASSVSKAWQACIQQSTVAWQSTSCYIYLVNWSAEQLAAFAQDTKKLAALRLTAVPDELVMKVFWSVETVSSLFADNWNNLRILDLGQATGKLTNYLLPQLVQRVPSLEVLVIADICFVPYSASLFCQLRQLKVLHLLSPRQVVDNVSSDVTPEAVIRTALDLSNSARSVLRVCHPTLQVLRLVQVEGYIFSEEDKSFVEFLRGWIREGKSTKAADHTAAAGVQSLTANVTHEMETPEGAPVESTPNPRRGLRHLHLITGQFVPDCNSYCVRTLLHAGTFTCLLSLQLSLFFCDSGFLQQLARLASSLARLPLLELELDNRESRWSADPIALAHLFSRLQIHAPRLSSLRLRCREMLTADVLEKLSGFSQLRSLELDLAMVGPRHSGWVLSPAVLAAQLQQLPHLRYLTFNPCPQPEQNQRALLMYAQAASELRFAIWTNIHPDNIPSTEGDAADRTQPESDRKPESEIPMPIRWPTTTVSVPKTVNCDYEGWDQLYQEWMDPSSRTSHYASRMVSLDGPPGRSQLLPPPLRNERDRCNDPVTPLWLQYLDEFYYMQYLSNLDALPDRLNGINPPERSNGRFANLQNEFDDSAVGMLQSTGFTGTSHTVVVSSRSSRQR